MIINEAKVQNNKAVKTVYIYSTVPEILSVLTEALASTSPVSLPIGDFVAFLLLSWSAETSGTD